jgi:hydrogenase expression/formation protein HypE
VLQKLRAHPLGADAAIIGSVTTNHPGKVLMNTAVGGTRLLDMLAGEMLPRIC